MAGLKVRGSITSVNDKLSPSYLHKSLNELREAGLCCDVVLAMNNNEWKAHKTVLSAASSYFCAMFNSQFKEAKANRVILHDVDSDSVSAILEFIYSARVKLTPTNVFQLMDASNYFQISAIKLWINNYLQGNVTVENCVGLYEKSKSLYYHDLANTTLIFIRKHFMRVFERGEILQASGELLTTLLDSNFLNVQNENSLIKVIMKWINANTKQRRRYAIDLLNKLELRNIQLQKLTNLRYETIFRQENELLDYLDAKIEEWNVTTPAENSVRWRTVRYGSEQGVIVAIGGESEKVPTKSAECFTIGYEKWKRTIPQYIHADRGPKNLIPIEGMILARTNAASAYDAYNVYVLGGRGSISILKECEYYNIKANAWISITPLPVRLEGGSAVFFEGRLIFIGGRGQNGCSNAVWQLDEENGNWRSLPPLIHSRAFHSSISYGGYIYTIGGLASDNKTALRSVERYDPFQEQWSEVQAMHKARGKFGCALLNNHIYVIGGTSNGCSLRSVEKYVLEANAWSYVAPLTSPRFSCSAVVYENKVFCIGGTDGKHNFRSIYKYNPFANRWHYLFSLQSPRSGFAASVLFVPYLTREAETPCQISSIVQAGALIDTQ